MDRIYYGEWSMEQANCTVGTTMTTPEEFVEKRDETNCGSGYTGVQWEEREGRRSADWLKVAALVPDDGPQSGQIRADDPQWAPYTAFPSWSACSTSGPAWRRMICSPNADGSIAWGEWTLNREDYVKEKTESDNDFDYDGTKNHADADDNDPNVQ